MVPVGLVCYTGLIYYTYFSEDETTEEESSLAGDDMDKPTSGAVDTDPTPASATDSTQGTEAKGDEKSATEQGGFCSFSDISNME